MSDKKKKFEFSCCKCGNIPEILKIHTDNSKIELNCKICGKYEIFINEYFKELEKNNNFKKCSLCLNEKKNNEFFYCLNCKKDFCKLCKNNSEHKCQKRDNLIEINKKKNYCLEHNQKFQYYCFDCQENFCENRTHINHETHKTMKISKYNEVLIKEKNKVKEINDELTKLVEFNNLILDNIDLLQDNKYFNQSIKNIGKSLEEGNKRNSNDIKCLLNGLSNDLQNSNNAIEELIKKKIQLSRKEKYIHLNNRNLDDQDFKNISRIRFNQLKEIDISENKIIKVEPFNKMSLPFLEFLNLSFNEIETIKPVTQLKSKKLEYIFLQKNHIKDIETFLQSDFPNLKLLRVEDNDIIHENNDQNNEENKKANEILVKIDNKYPKKFIYKSLKEQIKEFTENFKEKNMGISNFEDHNNVIKDNSRDKNNGKFQLSECDDTIDIKEKNTEEIKNIVENIFKIDLHDIKGKDKMLKYLFLIITFKNENKIKELILRNNEIEDASMLKRVNFKSLKKLDLAVNKIKDTNFLKDIKAKNLEELYLDNNNLQDIYPMLSAKFEKLKVLSINQNAYDSYEMEQSPGFKELVETMKKKNNDFIYQINLADS
jgi:uncharacterized protein YsxB (DUF464 family)